MEESVGIFEAKTKLAALCSRVEEDGAAYVIKRRGKPVARLVPVPPQASAKGSGVLARMRRTVQAHGAIPDRTPEFPEVWNDRRGTKPNPLDQAAKMTRSRNRKG